METKQLKQLTRNELTVYVYINLKGEATARNISYALQIDISHTYKLLSKLIEKNFIYKNQIKLRDTSYVCQDIALEK